MKSKIALLTLITITFSLICDAQITWAPDKARYLHTATRVDMVAPYYNREATYLVQDGTTLYRRWTRDSISSVGTNFFTNKVQIHTWATLEYLPYTFIVTDAWEIDDFNGVRTWRRPTSYIGRYDSSPPGDVGTTNWTAAEYRQGYSSKCSWWVTASTNNTEDRLLRFEYYHGLEGFGGHYYCYANYRIPSNAVHYVITPTIAEMRGPYCLSITSWTPYAGTVEMSYVWGAWGEQFPWPHDGSENCEATGASDIPTVIPDPVNFTNTWTASSTPSSSDVDIEEPVEPAKSVSYSPPPPGDGGGTGEANYSGTNVLRFKMLHFNGTPGRSYFVDSSTNLVDWESLGVADEPNEGTYELQDRRETPYHMFYRIYPID